MIGEMMTMSMMMNGKINFEEIYKKQMQNQNRMLVLGLYENENAVEVPFDDVKISSYHIQQLISEIGEVLSADKRWKNFRNEKYDKENKLEEIADCFIVLMNIAMFSGISYDMLIEKLNEKVEILKERTNEIKF